MHCAKPQPWEAIQHAAEDEVRQGNGRLEGIANDIGQVAIALDTSSNASGLTGIFRVHHDCGLQRLSSFPEGIECWI